MSVVGHATVPRSPHPFRTLLIAVESVVALGAVAGTWQLWTGTFAPPVSDLEPLGLDSWRLPAVWLFASVALPAIVVVWAAATRRPWTPLAAIAAGILLVVEVTVQIPFVGPSWMQLVFGVVGLGLVAAGLVARHAGWEVPRPER